ncbi:MAG TPA: hypothetical protein VH251_10290 [Verrucomicrobiae bacterium]|nr:hypothetical protein [Verrucomicrobiae bacterium]
MAGIRFDRSSPAMVFDHVSDAAVNGLSVQGDKDAESARRISESQDIYLGADGCSGPRPFFCKWKAR